MNITDKPNTELLKLQPKEVTPITSDSAVVNGDNKTSGGSFLTNLGYNSFAKELDMAGEIFAPAQDGLFSFEFGEFQGLSLNEVSDDNYSAIEELDSAQISKEDAKFFVSLVYEKDFNNLKTDDENLKVVQSQRTMETSKTLLNLLSKASNDGKPIRLDFDNNITLVLKVGQDGKINANFFPSDKVAEEYLRNNIPYLKQELDSKNISYGSLNYFNQRNRGQNKEKNNE